MKRRTATRSFRGLSVLLGSMLLACFWSSDCLASEWEKMDFSLYRALRTFDEGKEYEKAGVYEVKGISYIKCFIEVSEEIDDFDMLDVDILARAGRILVVSAPLDRVRELARLPQVVRMEGPSRVFPALNLSVPDIRAPEVWSDAWLGFNEGEGVVVGMVDSGINLQHEAFLDDEGRTRVRYVWDMTSNEECDPERIAAGACRQVDEEGHGTAVMGALAGNWRASCDPRHGGPCRGVAPGAEIVAVKLEGGTPQDVVQGVEYIFQKAEQMGLPAVVNLSLGAFRGPRDGSTPFEKAISELTGPGRIVVAAAGNEGLKNGHAQVTLRPGGFDGASERMIYTERPDKTRKAGLQGWYSPGQDIRVRVLNTFCDPFLGCLWEYLEFIGWQRFGQDAVYQDEFVKVTLKHSWSTETARGFTLEIEGSGGFGVGEWQVQLEAAGAGGPDTVVNLWIDPLADPGPRPDDPSFLFTDASASYARTLTTPCTADEVICVSSYNTRCVAPFCGKRLGGVPGTDDVGTFSAFSSRGPRSDGVLKPEVGAPGQALIMPWIPGSTDDIIAAGTSFAAPLVAGTVALLLRGDEQLTPKQIVSAFTGHLRPWQVEGWSDEFGGYRGQGRLDAYALAKYLYFDPPVLFGGRGGNDFCFIATAVFGDSRSPRVDRLREFRDRALLPHAWGTLLVDHYYRRSPPVAAWLERRPRVAAGVRAALLPAVGFADLTVHRTSAGRLAAVSVVLFPFAAIVWCRRRLSPRPGRTPDDATSRSPEGSRGRDPWVRVFRSAARPASRRTVLLLCLCLVLVSGRASAQERMWDEREWITHERSPDPPEEPPPGLLSAFGLGVKLGWHWFFERGVLVDAADPYYGVTPGDLQGPGGELDLDYFYRDWLVFTLTAGGYWARLSRYSQDYLVGYGLLSAKLVRPGSFVDYYVGAGLGAYLARVSNPVDTAYALQPGLHALIGMRFHVTPSWSILIEDRVAFTRKARGLFQGMDLGGNHLFAGASYRF